MVEETGQDILVMAIHIVTKNDVLVCADELGVCQEQITDEMIEEVKEDVSQRIGQLREKVKDTVRESIEEQVLIEKSPRL
ncbi:hypothetical protein ACFLUP_03510 [Chloroflexota bacterium]